MKNISTIVNVVLAIAVIVLYVLHFSGTSASNESSASDDGVMIADDLNVAYINFDSLLKNYEFIKDELEVMEQKREQMQQEIVQREQSLQREYEDLRRNAANMTINQANSLQESIQQKAQNLQVYQQTLTQQLMQEEARVNNELYDAVSTYLNDYGNENSLQMVLSYQRGSALLFAKDSLNITDEIIKGLNKKYSDEKSGVNAQADSLKN